MIQWFNTSVAFHYNLALQYRSLLLFKSGSRCFTHQLVNSYKWEPRLCLLCSCSLKKGTRWLKMVHISGVEWEGEGFVGQQYPTFNAPIRKKRQITRGSWYLLLLITVIHALNNPKNIETFKVTVCYEKKSCISLKWLACMLLHTIVLFVPPFPHNRSVSSFLTVSIFTCAEKSSYSSIRSFSWTSVLVPVYKQVGKSI